tara:strand:+ start:14790 stop:15569 length:780 start_codon:yes stop_codon:yes gene_type:complete
LKGQRAFVLGGAQGIGRAITEAFCAEECSVGVFDRDDPKVETLAAELPAISRTFCGDVSNFDEVQAAAEAFGPVNHVVYAVGVGSGKFGFPFWNLEPSDWPKVLEINLTGAANAAHAFAPKLIQAGEDGTILFLTSVAGQMGSQTDPPYSAAKAGLINFMQCAAKDFAPYKIRANAIAPGMVQTQLNRSVWAAVQEQLPEQERQDYESWGDAKINNLAPLNRWQTPEEFGAMAVFLASHHARNITGQTLNIDGGQVMHG